MLKLAKKLNMDSLFPQLDLKDLDRNRRRYGRFLKKLKIELLKRLDRIGEAEKELGTDNL